jgi:hypothetical protein
MAIIGINGKIGVGKDTVGSIIQYLTSDYKEQYNYLEWAERVKIYSSFPYSPWKIKKFAGKLKEIAALLTGCTIEQLEDQEFKKETLGFNWRSGHCIGAASTYRELLQLLGTEIMRDKVHPNVWVNALMADYTGKIAEDHQFIDDGKTHPLVLEYPKWIITDMRFPNELEAVEEKGGITIRVVRPVENYPENPNFNGDMQIAVKMAHNHPSETALDNAKFDYVIDNNGTIDDLIQKVKVILVKEDIIK